jgi:ergothioneine biosynthesis protein EgtB
MWGASSLHSEATLLDELERAWERSDRIFEWVGPALHERPISLRHPFVFYLGHLPAFARNQIVRGVLGAGPMAGEFEGFDELFERGIDPMSEDSAPGAATHAWPEVERILAFRNAVRMEIRASVARVFEREEDELCRHGRILAVVLEHELMHHETLLYMLQQLPLEGRQRPSNLHPLRKGEAASENRRIHIDGGRVILGADFDEIPFGWDNEFPRAEVLVKDFEIDSLPVTEANWLEFTEAGGYRNPKLWQPGDLEWLSRKRIEAPSDWERDDGRWMRRTLFESVPLSEIGGWPAIVSQAEACAYARWRGARLPSEAELHRAAYGSSDPREQAYPWGNAAPNGERGNFDFLHLDPVPVGSYPQGASAAGVHELVGNGWEWTHTAFVRRPGFRAWIRSYPGYSADFFDGEHRVLFGAAWPTDARLLRRSFTNWFQTRYPYVFATFRLVRP